MEGIRRIAAGFRLCRFWGSFGAASKGGSHLLRGLEVVSAMNNTECSVRVGAGEKRDCKYALVVVSRFLARISKYGVGVYGSNIGCSLAVEGIVTVRLGSSLTIWGGATSSISSSESSVRSIVS